MRKPYNRLAAMDVQRELDQSKQDMEDMHREKQKEAEAAAKEAEQKKKEAEAASWPGSIECPPYDKTACLSADICSLAGWS